MLLKLRFMVKFESYSAHHFFSAGCGDSVRKLQPTIQPTSKNSSLNHLCRESHFLEERALCGPCFISVALRVEIQRRLDGGAAGALTGELSCAKTVVTARTTTTAAILNLIAISSAT
jgi:hypothetical protein